MMNRGLYALSFLLASLPAFAQAPAETFLWPEAQRAFLEDGAGLLLTAEQRTAFLALDEAGRDGFIRDFLDRDPLPETPANELREGVDRRSRLARLDFASPQDARAQLLFLRGRPTQRLVVDCAAFKPLELWAYGTGEGVRSLVLYRPSLDEPFRLWLPIDSKRALYTAEMESWLEQWETLGMGGKRIDKRFCPDAGKVDHATGVDGLSGKPLAGAAFAVPVFGKDETGNLTIAGQEVQVRAFRWARPKDRAALFAAPADLATWAREAAVTALPPEPLHLEAGAVEIDFPRRDGQRLVARALLSLPSEAGLHLLTEEGKPRVRLIVEGLLEVDGRVFESFRMRYQVAPPAPDAPAALLVERSLRPGQAFLLRLTVKDETTGAEARLARGFRVPFTPVASLPAATVALATAGKPVTAEQVTGSETLLLMPPPAEVVLSLWRADTVVTGKRIERVVFLVDGEAQLARTRPPFSAEVKLARFPREQVVRVEGYDAAGELVAADQVVLNQSRGGFKVIVTDPPRGSRSSGRVAARAEVVVPEERKLDAVEFRVNDQVVATLASPPWQHEVEVPPGNEMAYLSVVAQLDDGTRTEALRFLRAPAHLDEMEVDLVELFATVLDSSGRPVRGLAAGDFEVTDGGRPQKISRFEQVENLPLQLGIALDTSFSMASSLAEAQRAAAGFLKNLITAGDRSFALGFASRPVLLMPPVDDVEAVSLSLEDLRAYGRTALHDAIITSLYYFRGQRGQRALVLLTDGDDTGSATSWQDALEYARRSGVAVYPIGLNVSGLALETRGKLNTLAEGTGGRVFFIDKADELAAVYDQIEEELRHRYFLAYNADQPADENGFRRIEVKARRGQKVRMSRGNLP